MNNVITANERINAPNYPDPTDIVWAAESIIAAADTIRRGSKLSRQDYLAIARVCLRCVGREVSR